MMRFAVPAMRRRHILRAGAAMLAAGSAAGRAAAQGFPTQPIRLVVPFAAGGAVDLVGRLVGQGMAAGLGQPVVVENRTGASGAIGAQSVARAPADGHTLLMAPITSFAMLAGLPGNNLNLDLLRDFAPIGTVGAVPIVLVAANRLQVESVGALVALARRRPAALSYASAGNGSTEHLAAELFAQQAGISLLHVPYRGGAPALADVLGGQVDLMFATLPNTLQNGGALKILAIATAARSGAVPEVPTAAEAGFADFAVSSIYGLLAPAGTPAAVVDRLNRAMQAAVAQPELRARLQQQGVEAAPTGADTTRQQLASEVARWAGVIRDARISLQ
ncbi:tripartite tricarboxylate transporter substrate binding protein [Roseomonas hellenica]|uniref:Tripartite tricarboxylate transporter substrate binding protein n=1 Tax=Plastoroseomonas hellenica TaxID=2687306 RepID=A0ABS5EYV2_9PROT|nr:tripartite tricarboxylate transporter substrate binding protein [Plastoroseomonas hellenica]MBR0665473.1 tripartite tricarboxylate transporter substrate binding protein [Plastoroseomonas hellenica]